MTLFPPPSRFLKNFEKSRPYKLSVWLFSYDNKEVWIGSDSLDGAITLFKKSSPDAKSFSFTNILTSSSLSRRLIKKG